jgi:hypothetical protein
MIETVDLFDSEDCFRIRAMIHDLNQYWDRRHFLFPFFTLGVPTYMDADPADLQRSYLDKVSTRNPVLHENLGWMYQRLAECLSNHLSASVQYHPQYSVPGFHIYLYNDLFSRDDLTSTHFDLQYNRLKWEEKVNFDNSLSFTLAVMLPHKGGGMFYWDLFFADAGQLNPDEILKMRESRREIIFRISLGSYWYTKVIFCIKSLHFRIQRLMMSVLHFKDTWRFIMTRGIFTGEVAHVLHTWIGSKRIWTNRL